MTRIFDQRNAIERAVRAGRAARILLPAGALYGGLLWLRRKAFSAGVCKSVSLGVPVISVGNITTGGSGKTPFVEFLAAQLIAMGRKPAILSRGYGAGHDGVNDESKELAWRLPGAGLYANPDRVSSGRRAIADGADCIVLDDGFQHMRVQRNLNIVLIDAMDPFGGGACIPAGALREPVSALKGADILVITRADAVDGETLARLREKLQGLAPAKKVFECVHKPVALTAYPDGIAGQPAGLAGKPAFVFCGIGNPSAFVRTVDSLGATVTEAHFLPDHNAYTVSSAEDLARACDSSGAQVALTTEKDIVKIGSLWHARTPLRALRVEISFVSGADRFQELLKEVARR